MKFGITSDGTALPPTTCSEGPTHCDICAFCTGTGWRKYDHNHAQVCEHCCKHDKGWWELTEHHAGYVAGKDNACCRAGCGTMRRDLSNNIDN